ncbi:unnamed protein product [Boreogadus saida]
MHCSRYCRAEAHGDGADESDTVTRFVALTSYDRLAELSAATRGCAATERYSPPGCDVASVLIQSPLAPSIWVAGGFGRPCRSGGSPEKLISRQHWLSSGRCVACSAALPRDDTERY